MKNDLISREELKDYIDNWFAMVRYYHPYSKSTNIPKEEVFDIIDNTPTFDMEGFYKKAFQNGEKNALLIRGLEGRPHCDWITITKSTFPQYQPDEYKCSNCNKLVHIKYYYCPFCGVDMRGEDNGKQ